MVTTGRDERVRAIADRLYDTHARPREGGHGGEFIAITEDGRITLGTDRHEACQRANALHGPGAYVFKVGDRAVGRWRYGATAA